ncbi:MAG: hypothetical protein AVDCRST_MAG55-1627, partial [uncultured Rubrobacteraceae bacterium]
AGSGRCEAAGEGEDSVRRVHAGGAGPALRRARAAAPGGSEAGLARGPGPEGILGEGVAPARCGHHLFSRPRGAGAYGARRGGDCGALLAEANLESLRRL